MKFLRTFFLQPRFFLIALGLILLFVVSYSIPWMYRIVVGLTLGLFTIACIDIVLLYAPKKAFNASRLCPDRLSNGDDNQITLFLENRFTFPVNLDIVDEIPHQFQRRDINWKVKMDVLEGKTFNYLLRPVKRGEYDFGAVNIFVTSPIGLVSKRYQFDENKMVAVYPSFLQMRKFELAAISNRLQDIGIKKLRRIGHSMEFEQIKEYVQGDDTRTINWKATARKNDLMVNQFQEEKSQQVFSVIDKGRLMKMPFEGLSLLDYSINASLVISNIAIKKEDKAGLVTFSNKISTMLPASKKPNQMFQIQEALYNQLTRYKESNFALLNAMIRRKIHQRSLLLVYTNFESLSSFNRQLRYFKLLAKQHLVVIIFFENTELKQLIESNPENLEEVYYQTIAEKLAYEKRLIVKELRKHGILSLLTKPEDLTVNTINKYLEIKARGML